jgi:uncharacterized protein YndB with AHSA1/START domain
MKTITVQTTIARNVETVWNAFVLPEHIVKWYQASDDWHCPRATNDLRVDGTFVITMASKDGANGFDFTGTYSTVEQYKTIEYAIVDGRKVTITFEKIDENSTKVVETFEMESTHTEEQQRQGWQAILDSLKHYTESV